MSIYFYGRAKARDNAKIDIAESRARVTFSTSRRPQGTKAEDPDHGVQGANRVTYDPAVPVTLYRVVNGTGEGTESDPMTLWKLETPQLYLDVGDLTSIGQGHLLSETAISKTDSEGAELRERRFEIELPLNLVTSLCDQPLGRIAAHAASIVLAVLAQQVEIEEAKPSKTGKVKKAQLSLLDAPEPPITEEQGTSPSEHLPGNVESANSVLADIQNDDTSAHGDESMIARASSARRAKPKFELLAAIEGEALDARIERSLRESGLMRVRLSVVALACGLTLGKLTELIDGTDLIGRNPNGTCFSMREVAASLAGPA